MKTKKADKLKKINVTYNEIAKVLGVTSATVRTEYAPYIKHKVLSNGYAVIRVDRLIEYLKEKNSRIAPKQIQLLKQKYYPSNKGSTKKDCDISKKEMKDLKNNPVVFSTVMERARKVEEDAFKEYMAAVDDSEKIIRRPGYLAAVEARRKLEKEWPAIQKGLEEYLHVETVKSEWYAICSAISRELDSIPKVYAEELSECTTPQEAYAVMDKAIQEAKQNLSEVQIYDC